MSAADIDLLAGLRNGAWLDAQVFPPLTYAVPGVIPEGFTLFVGPPKAGKSFFVLSVALGLAEGGAVLGRLKVDQRPVLYLALEDGDRRMLERSRQLMEGAPLPQAFEYMTTLEVPGSALATVETWLNRHPGQDTVVILDTLGRVMPPSLVGESAYARDYRVGAALKRLVDQRPGSSLVVNHHDRKAESSDFVDSVSGTQGLAGAADTVVVLSRPRHERSGLLRVTGRDVEEAEYAVTFGPSARWELDGADLAQAARAATAVRSAEGLGDRSAEVVAIVSRSPQGVRAAAVAEELGIDAKQAGTYLGRLADTSRIQRAGRGLYTPVGCVESVESQPEPHFGSHTSHTTNTPTDEGDDSWLQELGVQA